MTHPDSETTRLAQYSANVLPWAHGHQLKGITTCVGASSDKQTGNQAELARGRGNQEAGVERLSRLLHNERLAPHRLAAAVLVQAREQVAAQGQRAAGPGRDDRRPAASAGGLAGDRRPSRASLWAGLRRHGLEGRHAPL
jgi:hypothetical protein